MVRPISESSGDAAQDRRRENERNKKRRRKQRQLEARLIAEPANNINPTATPPELCIRLNGLNLGTLWDPESGRQQANAIPQPIDLAYEYEKHALETRPNYRQILPRPPATPPPLVAELVAAQSSGARDGEGNQRSSPVRINMTILGAPPREQTDVSESFYVPDADDASNLGSGDLPEEEFSNSDEGQSLQEQEQEPVYINEFQEEELQAEAAAAPVIDAQNDSSIVLGPDDSSLFIGQNGTQQEFRQTVEGIEYGDDDDEEEDMSDEETEDEEHRDVLLREMHGNDETQLEDLLESQDPVTYATTKLYHQLVDGFHGCTDEMHQMEMEEHDREVDKDRHYTLGQALPNMPDTLGDERLLDRHDMTKLSAKVSKERWEKSFHGYAGASNPEPVHVCLHQEETKPMRPFVVFDVDSYLGFARSLAFANKGFVWQPIPLAKQSISTDVHVSSNYYQTNHNGEITPRQTMLKRIPHLYLGHAVGEPRIDVFVLFPRLHVSGRKFVAMKRDQIKRWLDEIVLPAFEATHGAHYTQHAPASFASCWYNTFARQIEDRVTSTRGYQTQTTQTYTLQPDKLKSFWEAIKERTRLAGLQDLDEPTLYLTAKNMKLQFKANRSRPNLVGVIRNFQDWLGEIVRDKYITKAWVDIGKEICSPGAVPAAIARGRRSEDGGRQPQTYLWKTCCLQSYGRWMHGAEKATSRRFNVAMLRDASNMTFLTRKGTKLARGGLVYSQFYASLKEMTDPGGHYTPFKSDGLEILSLDKYVYDGLKQQARAGNMADQAVVATSYKHSKKRAYENLSSSNRKSFGIREEHRMSMELFKSLKDRLVIAAPPLPPQDGNESREAIRRAQQAVQPSNTSHHDDDDPHGESSSDDDSEEQAEEGEIVVDTRASLMQLEANPSYMWAVKTSSYTGFVKRNINRFTTGFEMVRAKETRAISFERTKMLAMFLRCLRYASEAYSLRSEGALWWSSRTFQSGHNQPRTYRGLGFGDTMEKYGFCWLLPVIDWSQMKFKPNVTMEMLFGNGMLRSMYARRHADRISNYYNDEQKVEALLLFLTTENMVTKTSMKHQIIEGLAYLTLKLWRADVIDSCSSSTNARLDINEGKLERWRQRDPHFSYANLVDLFVTPPTISGGPRTKIKRLDDLFYFFFGLDNVQGAKEIYSRRAWKRYPYRERFLKIYGKLRSEVRPSHKWNFIFQDQVKTYLYEYNSYAPHPNYQGITQTNNFKQRMWCSWVKKGTGRYELGIEEDTKRRVPPEWPKYLSQSIEEWQGAIDFSNNNDYMAITNRKRQNSQATADTARLREYEGAQRSR